MFLLGVVFYLLLFLAGQLESGRSLRLYAHEPWPLDGCHNLLRRRLDCWNGYIHFKSSTFDHFLVSGGALGALGVLGSLDERAFPGHQLVCILNVVDPLRRALQNGVLFCRFLVELPVRHLARIHFTRTCISKHLLPAESEVGISHANKVVVEALRKRLGVVRGNLLLIPAEVINMRKLRWIERLDGGLLFVQVPLFVRRQPLPGALNRDLFVEPGTHLSRVPLFLKPLREDWASIEVDMVVDQGHLLRQVDSREQIRRVLQLRLNRPAGPPGSEFLNLHVGTSAPALHLIDLNLPCVRVYLQRHNMVLGLRFVVVFEIEVHSELRMDVALGWHHRVRVIELVFAVLESELFDIVARPGVLLELAGDVS